MKTNHKTSLLSPPAKGHASAVCYLKLFHGRKTPDEQLSDWGSDGPVIGPVGLSLTYGGLKLHAPDWSDFEDLPVVEGLIRYAGVYYGDCEILISGDPLLWTLEQLEREFHDYATFQSHAAVTRQS